MLEKLLGNVKSEVGGQIKNQTGLPDEKLDHVFSIIGDVFKRKVSGHLMGGGLSGVMNLFSRQQNNPEAEKLQSDLHENVVGELESKAGLSRDVSGNIAKTAVPSLIDKITNKNSETPDDDPSPLHEIFGTAKSAIGEAAKGLFGKFR